MSGWTPALRIARRELLRAKGRTLLALLMVLLPVTAVVALSTLLRTSQIDPVESLPRELGPASARLDVSGARVQQDPYLRSSGQYDAVPPPSAADLLSVLPPGAQLLPVRFPNSPVRVQVGERTRRVGVVAVDVDAAGARGPFQVEQGRAPDGPDEVAVFGELAEAGVALGSRVAVDGEQRLVTGVVSGPRDLPFGGGLLGAPEAVGLQDAPVSRYFVSGPAVDWQDVQELNALGLLVLSRSVVLDPPPDDQVSADLYVDDARRVELAILGLIAVMAVLQVVLLAGPAFAVGARRQRRSLALLACGGASPAQVRRVVLAQGLWVGLTAAAVGVPAGVAVAALARAPLTALAGAEWGPFEVTPVELLLVAALGAGTALLAALLPAVVMSRQPLVAALQGRRVTGAGAARPAVAGLVLVAAGVVVMLASLTGGAPFGYAELGIAAGAVPTVLGAVLLAPAALSLLGRLAGRLPLPLRFAVRDADRQRGRTAPAVAAVAAVVAAVVALGTAGSSDQEQERRTYVPSGPPGTGLVVAYSPDVDLTSVADSARRALPAEQVRLLTGLRPAQGDGQEVREIQLCRADERPRDGRCTGFASSYASSLGADLLVGEAGLAAVADRLAPGQLAAAQRALADGAVLVAVSRPQGRASGPVAAAADTVVLRPTTVRTDGTQEQVDAGPPVTAPAQVVLFDGPYATVRAILPEAVGERLGAGPVALLVGDDLSEAQETALRDAVEPFDDALSVGVERGYQDTGDRTVLLVLSLVAGVLVLGGTLAATSLALSEARPDLATLGQVGARPRTRRLVAGCYALVLGLVGAVLGAAAGLLPGVAAAVPLTRGYSGAQSDYVVVVPWELLALVLVVLPLVSAGVSALLARGRDDGPRRRLA